MQAKTFILYLIYSPLHWPSRKLETSAEQEAGYPSMWFFLAILSICLYFVMSEQKGIKVDYNWTDTIPPQTKFWSIEMEVISYEYTELKH